MSKVLTISVIAILIGIDLGILYLVWIYFGWMWELGLLAYQIFSTWGDKEVKNCFDTLKDYQDW